jgi:hypothetical protein
LEEEPVIRSRRLALVPVLALAFAGTTTAAHATTEALSSDAVGALVVASCQVDTETPITLEELAPQVLSEADVTVVAGELTAHIVRAEVNTVLGDTQECTFGVLHRDAQLARVQYEGGITLAVGDGIGGTAYASTTEVEIGTMGLRSPVDPTTEVPLEGVLVPLDEVVEDPTYTISVERKALEVVPIAVNRTVKDAAARLLRAQLKAAAQLEAKEVRAAGHQHSAKAVAAAHRSYDRRVAAAQAAYDRATSPKSVTRPVSHLYELTGSVALAG